MRARSLLVGLLLDPGLARAGARRCFGKRATIVGGSGPDVLTGTPGDDVIVGLDGDDTLRGRGGSDLLCGGDGDDELLGRGGDDSLDGGGGGDTLDSGKGTNMLIGGDGNDAHIGSGVLDEASFAGSPGAVRADLSETTPQHPGTARGWGRDSLVGIEAIVGSDFDDDLVGDARRPTTLRGGSGNDSLTGGRGADLFDGGSGDDTIDGGGGPHDIVSYASAPGPVVVDLVTGVASGHGDDSLTAVHGVHGSAYADTIVGDGTTNTLVGGEGDDSMDGGDGNDFVAFETASGPVMVDLGMGIASGEGADTLTSIENAIGSAFDDTLHGTEKGNRLSGGGGNDAVSGGAGRDVLEGGAGNDTIDGGEGDDTIDGGRGVDAVDGGGGADTCLNAEATLNCEDPAGGSQASARVVGREMTGSHQDRGRIAS